MHITNSHNQVKTVTYVLTEKNQSKNLYTVNLFLISQNCRGRSPLIREHYNVLQTEVPALPAYEHLDR